MKNKLILLLIFCFPFSAKATDIDVLVVYSSEMKSIYTNPNIKIMQMLSWANIAFANSSADIKLNLLSTNMLDIPNNVEVSETLLNELRNNTSLMSLRNQFKPDITIYLSRSSSDWCGMAWLPREMVSTRFGWRPGSNTPMYATGLVAYDCGNDVFAHEIGHVLGAGHGVRDSGGGNGYPTKSSRGYGVDGLFVDVMAYPSLYGWPTRLQYFSSPNYLCKNIACGTANDNAAQGIHNYAPFAANYSDCYPARLIASRTGFNYMCK